MGENRKYHELFEMITLIWLSASFDRKEYFWVNLVYFENFRLPLTVYQ